MLILFQIQKKYEISAQTKLAKKIDKTFQRPNKMVWKTKLQESQMNFEMFETLWFCASIQTKHTAKL